MLWFSHFDQYHHYFQTRVFLVRGSWKQLPRRHREVIARRGNRAATEAVANLEFMDSLRQALASEFGLRTELRNPMVVDATLG
jgi:hypothetical protein